MANHSKCGFCNKPVVITTSAVRDGTVYFCNQAHLQFHKLSLKVDRPPFFTPFGRPKLNLR